MGFSLMNGLSAMGGAISQTAGAMALEQQRSQLEEQKIALADSLAGDRESRGRQEQGMINAKAADKEQTFQASQKDLDREQQTGIVNKQEAGEDRRAKLSSDTSIKTAGMSEGAANARLNTEIAAQVAAATKLATNERQKLVLDTLIKDATSSTPVMDKDGKPLETASGSPIVRSSVDAQQIYEGLRGKKGYEDMADIFKPVANAPPPVPANITGKAGLQWNPSKGLFRDASGIMYDKNGKPVQ